MSNDQEDYEQSDFIVADDDDAYLDVVMENLSNMITPKDSGNQPGRPLRPFSPPTSIHPFIHPPSTTSFIYPPSTTSSASVAAKISPLVTDMETVQIMEPETSVRAVDANNNPIFATSQTPYGFQAMTKRKTSKKSIFNFENIGATDDKGELGDSRDEGPNSGASMAMDTPSDSPLSVQRKFLRAKPRGSVTEKVSVNVAALAVETDQKATTPPAVPVVTGTGKPKSLYAFDSMDETTLKSAAMEFKDEKEYLEALKWNGLSPHVPSQQLPPVPTPKNPRKKADTRSDEESLLQQQQEEQQRQMLYLQQQQQQLQQQMAMNYGSQSTSQPYMGYYSQPSSLPTAYPTALNTSDALRASWMNSTQSSSASQPGNDLASQLQYYSGDISQLQLPSIRNAPPAVIPETYSYGFPYGQNPIDAVNNNNSSNNNNNFTAPGATPAPNDLPTLQGLPNPANITEIMNYQALLQRKMDELKQQAAGYDSSHNAGYYGGANRGYAAASSSAQADSDGEDAGTVGKAGSRASKSLSEISKRFVTIYGRDNTLDYIAGKVNPLDVSDVPSSFHRVDAAAEQLGVHVRRIYELIKILEILSLVQFAGDKRGKFSWRGNKDFLRTLGEIQEDGLRAFPLMAAQSGLLQFGSRSPAKPASLHNEMSMDSPGKLAGLSLRGALFLMDGGSNNSFDLLNLTEEDEQELSLTSPSVTGKSPGSAPVPSALSNGSAAQPQEEQFMVEIICKKFLQLFLVGMNYMSMSNAIQKLIPMEENQSLTDYNRVNATKIRRVYDVTNVLCSLNLIRKQTISRKAAHDAEVYNNIDIQGTGAMSSPVAVATHPVTAANNGSGTPASGNGKKSGGKANGNGGDRVDAKVLEWTSFNPAVIREQYLLMCRK